MNYLPLIGIALVVIGFALKFNPMLVVTVSAMRFKRARLLCSFDGQP